MFTLNLSKFAIEDRWENLWQGFLGNLGYSETVEIAVDNEPVLVAGMEFCKEARLRLGFSTGVTTNKNYDTSRTSAAERMIQTIRNLQKTLILQLEVNSVQDTRWTLHQILGHCPRSMALYSRYHCALPFEDHTVSGSDWTPIPWQVGQFQPNGVRWIRTLESISQHGRRVCISRQRCLWA